MKLKLDENIIPRLTVKGLLNLIYQFIISLRAHDPRGKLWIAEPGRLRIYEDLVSGQQEDEIS